MFLNNFLNEDGYSTKATIALDNIFAQIQHNGNFRKSGFRKISNWLNKNLKIYIEKVPIFRVRAIDTSEFFGASIEIKQIYLNNYIKSRINNTDQPMGTISIYMDSYLFSHKSKFTPREITALLLHQIGLVVNLDEVKKIQEYQYNNIKLWDNYCGRKLKNTILMRPFKNLYMDFNSKNAIYINASLVPFQFGYKEELKSAYIKSRSAMQEKHNEISPIKYNDLDKKEKALSDAVDFERNKDIKFSEFIAYMNDSTEYPVELI